MLPRMRGKLGLYLALTGKNKMNSVFQGKCFELKNSTYFNMDLLFLLRK